MSKPADNQWQKRVGEILKSALEESRTQLYEHEVYRILDIMGIGTPHHLFLSHEKEITRQLLSSFGSSRVVLKIVSPDVAHKEKLGGVRVLHKDIDFLQYSFRRMCEDIRQAGYAIEGALLVEHIDYSPELGNEVMIGFRESETFGPVISFSKGGSDAEHFAANFSPPNLILPPVSYEWARALLWSTEIRKKYTQENKQEYMVQILDTILKFSELSTCFSRFFPSCSSENPFVLTEFEINPFVFDRDRRMIALDGYACCSPKENPSQMEFRKEAESSLFFRNMEAFFTPRGIAVVGVSGEDQTRPGNIIASNLLKLERQDVYCINPRGGTTRIQNQKMPLYPSLESLPSPVELVVVTVPAGAAKGVVEQAVEHSCRGILLIPGGFSETSHDRGPEEEILRLCRDKDIRIMGPNCLGVVFTGKGNEIPGINTFFIPETKFHLDLSREKNLALFSQSGALGLVELSELRHAVSPKVVVSYGNQLDVDPCDLISYWKNDPDIRVIGVYIEGFQPGAGRRLFSIASRSMAEQNAIPIVVYKAGRTQEGQQATQSHTASIAGEYAVAKAAMKQAGLIVAETMAEHQGYIKTFAMLYDREVKGSRTAVITNAGYEKANAADNLRDLKLAGLDETTRKGLSSLLPPFVTIEPLLDLTPMIGDEVFVKAIDLLLSSKSIDSLLISIVPHSGYLHTTDREIEEYPENIAQGIVKLRQKHAKPFVVSLTATSGLDSSYNKMGKILESGGVPVFLTAEDGMRFLNEFIRYHLIRQQNRLEEWIR